MPSTVICMKNYSSELCLVLTAGHDVAVSKKSKRASSDNHFLLIICAG